MAPRRQQTVSALRPSNEGGGQERQNHHSKPSSDQSFKNLLQRAQTANKSHSSGSLASKQPPGHVMRESGTQRPHEARLPSRQPSHHTAGNRGFKPSHEARTLKEPPKQAATGASAIYNQYEARLKASVAAHGPRQQGQKHPASQRAQTQTQAPIPPSSSFKPRQRLEGNRPATIDEDVEEAWSDRNVAMYEKSLPTVAFAGTADTTAAFPTPKPFPSRPQPPPPSPFLSRPKAPPVASRNQSKPSILTQLKTNTKRAKEKQVRALETFRSQTQVLALDDQGGLFGDGDEEFGGTRFFGGATTHRSWKPPPSVPGASSSYRQTPHANNATTQRTAGSDEAKEQPRPGGLSSYGDSPDIQPGGSLPPTNKLENGDDSEPMDQQPPKGPFSRKGSFPLNSSAGIRAIQKTIPPPPPPPRPMVLPYETSTRSSRTTAQRFMNTSNRAKTAGPRQTRPNSPAFKKTDPSSSSKSQLYITANDLHLYKWRQQKVNWAETRERWAQLPGAEPKAEETLRKWFRAVAKAIEVEEVSQELCENVLEGVEGAEAELNRIVAELQSLQPQQTEPERGGFQKILPSTKAGGKGGVVKQEPGRLQQQDASRHLDPSVATAATISRQSPPRAAQGGKFYDTRTFQAYIDHIGETMVEGNDDDDDSDAYDVEPSSSRQPSPLREADCIQWEYYMQRRDFTADDLTYLTQDPIATASASEETDHDPDNVSSLWKTYTHPFSTLSNANAEAALFVWSTPRGSSQAYSATGNFSLSQGTDAQGMVTYSLKSDLGLAQVRVARRLLTFQEHVLPERGEKEGWVPRVLWCVIVRIAGSKKGKEKAEEGSEILRNKIYSSLALANSRAVDEWLRLTMKFRSANLNLVQLEREVAKTTLLRKLERVGGGGVEEDGDGAENAKLFREVLVEGGDNEESGGGRKVEVFVQEVGLEGPRN